MTVQVAIVSAVAENGVIGRDGGMPWRLSTDLARFKALTMGAPVVMGRKTFETLKVPLPGRKNIVVTRNGSYPVPDGVLREASLDAALFRATALAEGSGGGTVFVIGGGAIYAQAMAMADELHVTHVEAEIDGDTLFPPIDPHVWTAVRQEVYPAGARDSHATRYVVYRRAG
ncbi:MAG: dihydrofolate reductase [Pararhizobium sp.]